MLIPVWPYLSSSLGVARPFTSNKVEKCWQTLWWAELDRLHSMTRAHLPASRKRVATKVVEERFCSLV